MEQQKKKRKKKQKWYALKNCSIDGLKHLEDSYEKLKRWFDPRCRIPNHKSFNTREEAYNWLYDITPPPSPPKPKRRKLWTDEDEAKLNEESKKRGKTDEDPYADL